MERVVNTIKGTTAHEIAENIRDLVDAGKLAPGSSLPPVRALAEQLGVNRNTVVAAYRQLALAGVVSSRGRTGTVIADAAQPRQEEGFAPNSVLTDVGSGNPAPHLLPDPATTPAPASPTPVLYGSALIDPALGELATTWIGEDQPREFRLSLTAGAVDAVERLLAQALTQGDAVALEDPCFLSSINTVQLGGYRPLPVPVDEQGMTVPGLLRALESGARAVICTPRAHNPTGASLSAERAAALREVLRHFPYVLVIEDDHFSQLSLNAYNTIIGPENHRWALIRSVSKFLGPDLRLAFVASDAATADRLGQRLSPGSMWVSHYLQRLTVAYLTDPATKDRLVSARRFYAEQNAAFLQKLAENGIHGPVSDGLNVWVNTGGSAAKVAAELMRRGWLCRVGDDFALTDDGSASYLRLTVHTLTDAQTETLVTDLTAAVARSTDTMKRAAP